MFSLSLGHVPEGSFPPDNYLGDKSSERHSGDISRGILSGANYLWDNFPGAIIQRAIIRGEFSSVAIVRGAIFLGGNYRRGQLSGNLQKVCHEHFSVVYTFRSVSTP